MILKLKEKKNIIDKISKKTKLSLSIILANYNYINVNKIYQLRKKARKKKTIINVVKNKLFKIAIKNTKFSCIAEKLKGPTIIAFSMKHPGSGPKIFRKFSKKNKKFKITYAVFEEKILNKKEIKNLAKMPTKKEAIKKIAILLKEITIIKFLRTLSYIIKIKKNKI
ncbi:50S ribosomal protein L10 [Buchnera aphidicola]|uniref:50S ribosomal protein L10 n=1 Tax=Buchnera aphidicola TaxID=9 RepID=UPI0031B88664